MTLIVKNSNGVQIASIADNTIEEKFDVSLIGEGVEDYIRNIDENFIKLLECFSGSSQPPKASTGVGSVEGQIWYNKLDQKIYYKSSKNGWISNSTKLGGKTLDQLREYVLAGLDNSGKLSVSGGVVTGKIVANGAVQVCSNIEPNGNEISNLGSSSNRFRNVYLKENGIIVGDNKQGFNPYNFIYLVTNDTDDVSGFPNGAMIVNQSTGEVIIKKSTGKFGTDNATFRKLVNDRQNSAIIGGNKFRFMGINGLIAGGWNGSTYACATIDKLIIPTPSNSTAFGNLTYGRSYMGASMSNGFRIIFQGGWGGSHGSQNGKMDYVISSTPSNASTFGTFGQENYGSSCVSDGTRGVIGPGYNATSVGYVGHHYMSKYVTIETLSDAYVFGSIKNAYWGSAVGSGTRGVFSGYSLSGWSSGLEYITIQTPSNSSTFGKLVRSVGHAPIAVTDTGKGVYFGGWNGTWGSSIEYINIATTSNAMDFGTIYASKGEGSGVSDGTYGVVSGGINNVTTSEYIMIQTLSNSKKFGDLTRVTSSRPGCASGN